MAILTEVILAPLGMEVLNMLLSKFPAHHASAGDSPACGAGDLDKYWSERYRTFDFVSIYLLSCILTRLRLPDEILNELLVYLSSHFPCFFT